MEIYERNINSSVRKLDDHTIVTQASLLDLNHSMRVVLKINLKTRQIEDASAEILKAPLKVCDSTLDLLKGLVGLKLERGINGHLIRVLGGEEGCTHLYELALNAVRLSFNVMIGMKFDWQQWISKTVTDEKFVELANPFLKGTCRPFKK